MVEHLHAQARCNVEPSIAVHNACSHPTVMCVSRCIVSVESLSFLAYADGKNYNDGPVLNVAAIRTVDAHFDDYMQWLATTWKRRRRRGGEEGQDHHSISGFSR